MGHVRSKSRSLGQIVEKPCVRSRGHIFSPIIMKLRMFVKMKSWKIMKMGQVWSKAKSLGQIFEKPYVHSRSHIFSGIIMKLGQNVCLD